MAFNHTWSTFSTVYPSLNSLWLLAHLAGITQSGTIWLQGQAEHERASLNPETYLYYYKCATGMPGVCTLPPLF